jgi:hypothetical protein
MTGGRKHLVTVVEETMQPAHVLLWLCKPEHDEKYQIAGSTMLLLPRFRAR